MGCISVFPARLGGKGVTEFWAVVESMMRFDVDKRGNRFSDII
jgi:hypothetical protein